MNEMILSVADVFLVIEKRQTDIHIELFSPATIPSTKKTRTKTQYHFGYDHVFCLSKVTEKQLFVFNHTRSHLREV